MSEQAGLRRVSVFTDDPNLQRAVRELEDNVQEAFLGTARGRAESLSIKRLRETGNVALGDFVLYEPVSGMVIKLPKATKSDAGRAVELKRASSSTTSVTVQPPAGVELDGFTSATLSTAWAYRRAVWDGQAWWWAP